MSQRSTECFCVSFQFHRELCVDEFPPHIGDQILEGVSVMVNAGTERFRKVKKFLYLIFHTRNRCCHVVEYPCHNLCSKSSFLLCVKIIRLAP